MDQPAPHKPSVVLVQPSIRSFFQPRQPTYAAPPAAAAKSTSDGAPPRAEDTSTSTNNHTKTAPVIEPQPITKQDSIPEPPPAPALPQPAIPSLPSNLPTLPPPPSLHPNASISPISATHIPALRRINSLLLQIPYPDSFYTTILTAPTSSLFSRAILWSDTPSSTPKLVGGIVCRLETRPSTSTSASISAIYIQSLTLLSPYRSLGLAAAALEHVASTASLLNLDTTAGVEIDTIYAHVWTENADGLRWYASRGFKRQGRPVAGYYFRLRPDTAWVVSRSIGTSGAEMSGTQRTNGEEKSRQVDATAAEQPRGRGTVLASALNLPGTFNPSQPPQLPTSAQAKTTPQRPTAPTSQSYQKLRPETEWNDLPAEMVASNNPSRNASGASTPLTGGPPPAGKGLAHLSAPGSGASSRSSSAVGERTTERRRKKERAYPKAAFGPGS